MNVDRQMISVLQSSLHQLKVDDDLDKLIDSVGDSQTPETYPWNF
ncbi:MAG: hypothetical protein ACNS60_18220 [Candidatus Cyclobacteriaceae bacterium M2_1C_046]